MIQCEARILEMALFTRITKNGPVGPFLNTPQMHRQVFLRLDATPFIAQQKHWLQPQHGQVEPELQIMRDVSNVAFTVWSQLHAFVGRFELAGQSLHVKKTSQDNLKPRRRRRRRGERRGEYLGVLPLGQCLKLLENGWIVQAGQIEDGQNHVVLVRRCLNREGLSKNFLQLLERTNLGRCLGGNKVEKRLERFAKSRLGLRLENLSSSCELF